MSTTIIDGDMARVIHNKGLSSFHNIHVTNVQQRNIKGIYVALPHRMAGFSIEEHNEWKTMKFKHPHLLGEKRPITKSED